MKCEHRLSDIEEEMSPSVWREWIEMIPNALNGALDVSPSVWREWIEIYLHVDVTSYYPVSLRVEGVD